MGKSRRSGIILAISGALVVIGSFGSWVTCATSSCGRGGLSFMALTPQSGVDFGPGWVTVLLGGVLIAGGAWVAAGVRQAPRVALIASGLALATAIVVVLATFVLTDPAYYGPNEGLYLVAAGGLLGLVVAWRLRVRAPDGAATAAGLRCQLRAGIAAVNADPVTVIDGVLTVGSSRIALAWPVTFAARRSRGILVLFDPDSENGRVGQFRNLALLQDDGAVVWRAGLPTTLTGDAYHAVETIEPIVALSTSSYRVTINPETGEVSTREFVK